MNDVIPIPHLILIVLRPNLFLLFLRSLGIMIMFALSRYLST